MNAKAKMRAQLSAYLDGELDEAQLRQVEEALENDGDLRAELADLAAARKLLRHLPAEKPPLDLVSRVLAEAERSQLVGGQTTESNPSPLRWIRYAASAAVLLVAATVGMIIAITVSSPDMYKDNLSRHRAPAVREDIRDEKTRVAVADGKRVGIDEDADKERPGRLATRGLSTDDTSDGRDAKDRGGADLSDGASLYGKLGKPGDNGRYDKPGSGGPEVLSGKFAGNTTVNGDDLALTKSGAGALTKSGNGDMSGGNTYTGDTTISAGTLGIATKGGTGRGGGNLNDSLAKGHGDNDGQAVSGPFDNVDSMSSVLAGNTTSNTIIYTDRLDQTQQQVEKVLGANGIAPVVTQQSEPSAAVNKTGSQAPQPRGNFYVANMLSPAQVQYEAYVTPEQLAKVQKALDSVRARQNVSQDVPALAYNEASARNDGLNFRKGQAGKDGYFAGKESQTPADKWADVALAKADGDRMLTKKEVAAVEPAPAGRPAAPAAEPGLAAKPAPVTPVAEPAPPAPVVVAPGRRSAEEAKLDAKQDVQLADRGKVQLAEAAVKSEAQPAKASESRAGSVAPRGQSAEELPKDAELRREAAQGSPPTPHEKPALGNRARATTPSVAEKPSAVPAPNQAAKTGDLAEASVQRATPPAERLAGQVAGPIGGQRASGIFNPPTAPPASAPATTWRQEQVVQVGVIRSAPLTQSRDAVAVQIASQPGQASQGGRLEQNLATANVQKLVITLNYRQAGEANQMLDKAAINAAAASQAAPAASTARQAKQQETQTQSK